MAPLILLWLGFCWAAPVYQAAGVVHSATGQPVLAPNTFVTIYGTGLATGTRSLSPEDFRGGALPVTLFGTGTSVFIDGLAMPVWYASPQQVNALIPSQIVADSKPKMLTVVVNGLHGGEVQIRVVEAAPGLFARDPETVIATRLDGSVIKQDSPAAAGQDVVLYATGLGPVTPEIRYLGVALAAAPLDRGKEFSLLLNGQAVDPSRVRYVGAAPGYAGLYQINLWLPQDCPKDPEVRIGVGDSVSPVGLRLPVQ